MTNEELKKLKELALSATSGPWVYDQMAEEVVVKDVPSKNGICDLDKWYQGDADGFYIAAVSPDVILDMIEQISLLQVALKHAYNGLNAIYHDPAK